MDRDTTMRRILLLMVCMAALEGTRCRAHAITLPADPDASFSTALTADRLTRAGCLSALVNPFLCSPSSTWEWLPIAPEADVPFSDPVPPEWNDARREAPPTPGHWWFPSPMNSPGSQGTSAPGSSQRDTASANLSIPPRLGAPPAGGPLYEDEIVLRLTQHRQGIFRPPRALERLNTPE
jgi:hypothetical protein